MATSPREALARAADVLERAEHSATTDHAEALVKVADGWMRLADSIVWQLAAEEGAKPLS